VRTASSPSTVCGDKTPRAPSAKEIEAALYKRRRP
jgi:hypothetical protein